MASQRELPCESDAASQCESQCERFRVTQCERRGKSSQSTAPRWHFRIQDENTYTYDVVSCLFYDPIHTSYGKSSSTFDAHQTTGCIAALRTTPAFKRRARLTARPDSERKIGCATNLPATKTEPPKGPCQQRHQNANPHHAASQQWSFKICKTRRGSRNLDAKVRCYQLWRDERKQYSTEWRQLKSFASKAVRKVIAASPFGDAIQEANLLNTESYTTT